MLGTSVRYNFGCVHRRGRQRSSAEMLREKPRENSNDNDNFTSYLRAVIFKKLKEF